MSYYTGFGAETDVAPAVTPVPQAPTVAQHMGGGASQFALLTMVLAGVVWVPTVGGALIGGKLDDGNGRFWGAAAGTAFTFMTLRYIAKQGL